MFFQHYELTGVMLVAPKGTDDFLPPQTADTMAVKMLLLKMITD